MTSKEKKLTPTQKKMYDLLVDMKEHNRKELYTLLPEKPVNKRYNMLTDASLRPHIANIRKYLRAEGKTIKFVAKTPKSSDDDCYLLVNLNKEIEEQDLDNQDSKEQNSNNDIIVVNDVDTTTPSETTTENIEE